VLILLIVINFIFLYSCSNTNNKEIILNNKIDKDIVVDVKKEIIKDERQNSDWLNILPEIEFSNIEKN
jgi:hypothetical protein